MSVFIKLAVACILLATATEGRADGIFIKENDVKDENNGIITHLMISSKYEGQAVNLQYQGVIEKILYNKDRTICAINFKPGVEVNEVYVVILMPSGKIKVIKDFNKQVGQRFKYGNAMLDTDYVYADRIESRIIEISGGTKGEPNYGMRVRIGLGGEIRLLLAALPGSKIKLVFLHRFSLIK